MAPPNVQDSGHPAGALRKEGDTLITPGGYKVEQLNQFEWQITGPDGKNTRIWGDPHVAEGDGGKWDFKREFAAANPLYAKYYGDGGDGFTSSTGGTSKGAPSAEAIAYGQRMDVVGQQMGQAVVADVKNWKNLDDAKKAAFKTEQPERYANMQKAWDILYPEETATGQPTTRSYTRSYGGGGYAAPPAAPTPMPPPTPLAVTAPAAGAPTMTAEQFEQTWNTLIAADPALPQLVTLAFGSRILGTVQSWLRMSAEQRAAWQAANPRLWLMLQRFFRWLLTQKAGQTGARTIIESVPVNAPLPPSLGATSPIPPAPPAM